MFQVDSALELVAIGMDKGVKVGFFFFFFFWITVDFIFILSG